MKYFFAKITQKTKKISLLWVCKRLKMLRVVVELHTTKTKKVVEKMLESFKNKTNKIYEKRDSFFQPTQTKSALTNFCDSVSNKRIKWLRPRITSA